MKLNQGQPDTPTRALRTPLSKAQEPNPTDQPSLASRHPASAANPFLSQAPSTWVPETKRTSLGAKGPTTARNRVVPSQTRSVCTPTAQRLSSGAQRNWSSPERSAGLQLEAKRRATRPKAGLGLRSSPTERSEMAPFARAQRARSGRPKRSEGLRPEGPALSWRTAEGHSAEGGGTRALSEGSVPTGLRLRTRSAAEGLAPKGPPTPREAGGGSLPDPRSGPFRLERSATLN